MIFFDFDGTLADIWKRYYEVFLAASGTGGIDFEKYANAKRRLCRDSLVAEACGASLPNDYWEKKRRLLENPFYLRLDTLLVAPELLLDFFHTYGCRILTIRRDADAFHNQLAFLGLASLSERSIILNPDGKESKTNFLRHQYPSGENLLIGDSEAEWDAAKLENTNVVLVRTGLRDPESFHPLSRCVIVDHVSAFIAHYKE